jgi:Replication-relaxation
MTLTAAREREALLRLASHRNLSTSQIERFLLMGSGLTQESRRVVTKQILGSLRRRALVAAGTHLVGGPGGGSAQLVYHLTDAGHRAATGLDPSLRLGPALRRSTLFLEHSLTTAEVSLAFFEAARSNPGHDLTEWAADWQIADRLGRSRVVPDALLTYSTRTWEFDAFLEVDLGSERPSRFSDKIAAYLDLYRRGEWRRNLRAWPLVLIVASDGTRASVLKRTTEDLIRRQRDAERLSRLEFDFAELSALLSHDGPLGSIWRVAGRDGLQRLLPADFAGAPTGTRAGTEGVAG